ncbi:MAG TPA: type II secretion system F family protein [Candidatus Saccharibacteria bacterium]|nr:type II secretion system F family protein [Candidatus Saccharibacteria bacterium]
MAKYSFVATDSHNNVVNGSVDMADRAAVMSALRKQGLRPLSIKDGVKKSALSLSFGKGKVKSDALVMFTRQLSAMVGAGVPLLRALGSLEAHSESQALKKILGDIIKDVEGGAPLANALEKHKSTFSDVYVNMVRAGEAAGILDDILKRLAMQQEKSASMRKKIKSAMTYPMVLMFITVGAFFGLMIFVIPQIGAIIKDMGGPDAELPLLTRIMLDISAAIISYWYIVFPILGALVYAVMRYIKTPKGKRLFHKFALKFPGVGGIVQKVAVARFTRTFSALMGAGVAVLEALAVTSRAVGNSIYEEAILQASEEVKNGRPLSEVIEANPLFPAIVAQMLSVGEETGQTDTVLVKVADFYEEEVDVAIDGISSVIEPVMIVFMGGMVGVIAASVMMPIAGLSQNIKE